MAALVPPIKDKEFVNWLKGALAVLFTKQGLDDFVRDELTNFQKDLLTAICQNKCLPAGTGCNSCTTENVLDCPTQNFCSKSRCKLHDACQPDRRPNQPCPNGLCQDIRDCIRREHRYNGPSWRNTDTRRWSTDAFEIAKCYMPPDGYSGVIRLEDTDFNGTLAVIINNKRFQNKMTAQLNQSNNVCIQAREVGRLIRHSPDLNLSDSELRQYIDIFIDFLTDSKYLAADRKAQEAVDKLNQLKLNTLTITTADITTVLNSAIKEKQQDALEAIKEDTKEAIECIQEKAKASIQHLMNVKDSITNVKTFTCASLNRITASKRSSISEIKCEAKKQKQEIEKTGAKEREKLKQVAGELPQREIKMQATHTTSRREELEENMREDLIKFYRKYYSNIPVSPLVEEHDVPLTEFYVQPPLTSIDIQRKFGHCQEFPKKTSIHSYRDVFFRGDGELYKDIYITANAGVGKTSFAKKICMTWCQAHRPTETLEQTFKSEDINSMKTFEFLFMVSLRDVDTSICDLDSMIEISILHYLARCSRFSRLDLEDILNERTCLVLLDGLDEWAHPTSCVRGRRDVHATPHIPARERCTILTTTRPWKLDVIKLGTSQIDRHIEINELDETSSKELTSNAITVLNRQSLPDQPKTVEEFESATSTLKLDNLRYIPYILLQMICLWFDGKSIGRTKCEIYTNIITLTLSRGLLKIENKGLPPMRGQNLETTYEIPPCLKSIDICKSHYEVLIGLAFLAFKKLFSSKAERNLVFDRSEVLQVISEDILRFCLEIGFLSQNKDYGLVSGRRSILSFQHKSVQEYFAALYISSHNQDIKDDIYKVCDTLPAILEMSNVFIFLAGFSPATVGKILQTIGETLSRDEKIEYFRNSIINSKSYVPKQVECWEIMKSWQRMLTDSVQEISNSGQSNAYLYIEDLLIDSTISIETCCILKLLTEDNTEKIKSISISECRTTEEFTDKLETLGLQDKHSLHKLIIQALPKVKDLHRLLSGSVQTLTVLILEFIIFQNRLLNREIMEIPSETVSILSSMTNMQIIYLRNIRMKHGDIERLFHYLMTRTTMTLINLAHMICMEHDDHCNAFCLDLSQHKKLEDLGLDTVPLSELHVDVSSVKLCAIGHLQHDVQSSLVKCLPEAINLRIVSFHSFQPEQSEIIIDTLQKLPKVERITIQFSNLGDTALILPTCMINLEIVHLYNAVLTSTSLRSLIESVDVLPKQVLINMLACTVIPEKDFRQVKEEIRSSQKYQVMFDGLNRGGEDMFQFQTWNK